MRYRYDVVESRLSGFVAGLGARGRRAYAKLLAVIWVYAAIDHDLKQRGDDAMAEAWEDAEMAFRGVYEGPLYGAVQNLWSCLPKTRWVEFQQFLAASFAAADKATDVTVARRFMREDRQKSVKLPTDPLEVRFAPPTRGAVIRDSFEEAILLGLIPNGIEELDELLAHVEQLEKDERAAEVSVTSSAKPQLKLVT